MSEPLTKTERQRLAARHTPVVTVTGTVCHVCGTPWLDGCDVRRALADLEAAEKATRMAEQENEALTYALGEVGVRSEMVRFTDKDILRLCLDIDHMALRVGGWEVAQEAITKLYRALQAAAERGRGK